MNLLLISISSYEKSIINVKIIIKKKIKEKTFELIWIDGSRKDENHLLKMPLLIRKKNHPA